MKTPRGTFFVIELLDNFYGGQKPVMKTVKVKEPRELTEKERNTPKYLRGWKFVYSRWWNDDVKYQAYQPTAEVEREVPTGEYTSFWVAELAKAKKFRELSKAETKLEQLKKEYNLTKLKPVIKKYEGERNVR